MTVLRMATVKQGTHYIRNNMTASMLISLGQAVEKLATLNATLAVEA